MSRPDSKVRFLHLALALCILFPAKSIADINPWIRSNLYDPGKWDTAGPQTSTRWLHPGTWTPGQDWGWLSGNLKANNVLGSWGGIRDRLELGGLTTSFAHTGQFAANPIGGRVEGGSSWVEDWNAAIFVDFERMLDIDRRIYLVASAHLQAGDTGLSPKYVGNWFPVQLSSSGTSDVHPGLVHLAMATQLLDNTAELAAGRLLAGDDFAFLAQACSSLNQGICGNPIAGSSSINFPSYPNAAWGARLKVKPGRSWYAQAGAYLVYPDLGNPSEHGVEFGVPDGSGVLAIGEAGYNVGNRSGQSELPGTYKVGGYFDSERLTDLETGAAKRGTWGAYVMGEQMLLSEDSEYANGLWAWLALSYAPPDVSEIQYMIAGGLTYVGPLPDRSDDAVSLIAAIGVFSDDLVEQGSETVLEINYRAQLHPALYVQPDIQYVINPDGYSNIDNAVIVGFAVGTTF